MSKIQVKPAKESDKDKTDSKIAKRPNFLQRAFQSKNTSKANETSLNLEDVGEDNLALEKGEAHKVSEQKNEKEEKKNQKEKTAPFNSNNNENTNGKLQPCSSKNVEIDDKEQNVTVMRRYKRISLLRLLLPILIFLCLLSMVINILIIKGVLGKNTGCTCNENEIKKGKIWHVLINVCRTLLF